MFKIMIKISLVTIALLLAMAQTIHADTVCVVTKSIPTYKTIKVRTNISC